MNKPLIYEPMTAITDLMIFGLGLYFALEVYGLYSTRLMNVHFYFALVFLFTGLSALFGAVIHGVGPHIDRGFNLILWKLTIYSIGLATFFIIMVGIYHIIQMTGMYFLFRGAVLLKDYGY